MNTMDKNMEMLNKLDAVLENVMFKIEFESLTEAIDANGKKNESKEKKKFMKIAKDASEKFWDKILEVVNNLLDKINYIVRTRSGKNAVLSKDITASIYCERSIPGDISAIINDVKNAEAPDIEMLCNRIEALRNKRKTYKAGTVLNIKGLYSTLKMTKKEAEILKKDSKKLSDVNSSVMSNIRGFYKDIIDGIRTLISHTDRIEKDKNNSNMKENNESSYIPYGMSRNEYIASIMLEAADLLKDDVVKDNSEVKELSDIPEEKPVKQDEYDSDVNGGEGDNIDHEEIKDLCDNDPEVIKLLTDDEDKSVTVDGEGCSNCNESVYDFFNLDF